MATYHYTKEKDAWHKHPTLKSYIDLYIDRSSPSDSSVHIYGRIYHMINSTSSDAKYNVPPYTKEHRRNKCRDFY